MADANETTTTSTTVAQSTTDTTTTDNHGVDANIQTQEGAPNPTPVDAAPTTDLNASGSIASPAVENPANSPTLNDVEQTQEERFADARSTALTNHAASNGQSVSDQSSATEEEVA